MKILKEKDNLLYLDHIILALQRILKYTKGLDEESFYSNDLVYDATIRNFEITGEAANKLSKEFKEKYAHIPWAKAIDMRNILIHEYDNVDPGILWKTITVDIPKMQSLVTELLRQIDK